MDEAEAKLQAKRIADYRKLENELSNIDATLSVLDTPTGFHKQSAFTGNVRESRRIVGMRIYFSATMGGEAPVELNLPDLNVHAGTVGDALRKMLLARRSAMLTEMGNL